MPSPFPGMDPYLEAHWLDVHTALVAEARGALNRLLPAGLVARVEERLAIESNEDVDVDPIIERFIRILDRSGQLITVLEFLSPTNKRPAGLEEYRERRAELLSGGFISSRSTWCVPGTGVR